MPKCFANSVIDVSMHLCITPIIVILDKDAGS